MNKAKSGASFVLGAMIGGMIGAAVTLLMAPQSGPETQAQIRDKGIALREDLETRMDDRLGQVEGKIDEVRHAMAGWLSEGSEFLNEKSEVLEEA